MSQLFSLNRFYDQLAPLYAAAISLLPVWQRYCRAVLPSLAGCERVLEVGPGPGRLLAAAALRHPMAAGLDRSAGMLRQARRHGQRNSLAFHLCQGDALTLPLSAHSFDGVTATFVLSAIPDGLTAMREMVRVLDHGGTLALVDAAYPWDNNLPGRALCRLWELGGDHLHDLAGLMRAAGLRIIQDTEFGAFNSIRLVVGTKE